ncbi:hypothetical protein [Neolewinella persica]|uniref:hypothetical protein n=1 Tax=Neolewinella persica TaxID=70998 RepID=UPI0003676573|nr:hypothetical protein [Neolewinella persica]
MVLLAKWIILLFGAFILSVGFLMLFNPARARATLRKAGSTNLINYAEISLRMVPAAALVLYAEGSRFPEVFSVVGWFMLATSVVLFFVPRRVHHGFAVGAAEVLQPTFVRWLAPLAFLFGGVIWWAVW